MIWGENSEEKIKTILKKARPGEYGPKEYDESITLDSNGRAIAVNKRLWIIPPLEECRNGFNKWQRVKINWEVLSTEDSDKSEVIVPENDESNLDF
jgi:hypothetical protein